MKGYYPRLPLFQPICSETPKMQTDFRTTVVIVHVLREELRAVDVCFVFYSHCKSRIGKIFELIPFTIFGVANPSTNFKALLFSDSCRYPQSDSGFGHLKNRRASGIGTNEVPSLNTLSV